MIRTLNVIFIVRPPSASVNPGPYAAPPPEHKGRVRTVTRSSHLERRPEVLGDQVGELPGGPQVRGEPVGRRSHAEPFEVLADATHVSLEQRVRVPVLARVDRLREVDD